MSQVMHISPVTEFKLTVLKVLKKIVFRYTMKVKIKIKMVADFCSRVSGSWGRISA